MKPFFIYILKCSDDSYYTGHTDNIEQRLGEHYQGCCSYTSKRRPLQVAYMSEFSDRGEAIAAEIQIKKWSRKKKEALMREDWEELKRLAKRKIKRKT